MVVLTKDDNFDELIKKGLILVDFYADWCGPCKMLAPNLEKLSEKYQIFKVNVDSLESLAQRYGVMSIPTLILFKDGEIIDKKIGYNDLETLENWLKTNE